jgi:hypothetical protein
MMKAKTRMVHPGAVRAKDTGSQPIPVSLLLHEQGIKKGLHHEMSNAKYGR